MRIHEIIATEEVAGPMTPEQLRQRNERQRRTQAKIAAERAKSAAKVEDLRADLP